MIPDNIQAVPLPSLSDVNQNFVGLTASATGYGKTSDGENALLLHIVNMYAYIYYITYIFLGFI